MTDLNRIALEVFILELLVSIAYISKLVVLFMEAWV